MWGQEPGAGAGGRDQGQRPGAETGGSDLVHFGSAWQYTRAEKLEQRRFELLIYA
jgi:hypothetical protein